MRCSINTGVQDRKHICQKIIVPAFDFPGATRAEINRLDLLDHDKARQLAVFRDGYVKGKTTIRVCNRTHNGQTRAAVEQVFADNKSRSPALLFVTGLRIESDRDEIALFGGIGSHLLPCFLAGRLTPVDFVSLVVLGNTCHEVLDTVPTAFPFYR